MGRLLVGTGWYGLVPRHMPDTQELFAVRRDWPGQGTHEFVSPRLSAASAIRESAADGRYWRAGPVRPRLSVVRISANDYRIHRRRRDCASPDCPTLASAFAPGEGR